METTTKEGIYIYCILEDSAPRTFGSQGIGGRGDDLYIISCGGIAVLVSNSPCRTYPASRENFLAHEEAIEEAMKGQPVLPVRFGTIADDEEEVVNILKAEQNKFKELLNEVSGKTELGLKALVKEEVVYKDIMEKYEEIKALKDQAVHHPLQATYYQRIEIGRRVETALQKEKELYRKQILGALSPLAVDVKSNPTYGELMILNAAFFITAPIEAEFDQEVQSLDARYGDKLRLKYVGPLPPFNFVNLVIQTKRAKHVHP